MLQKLGATITASNEEPGFPAANVVDGDPMTIWHTEYSKRQVAAPYDLKVSLPKEAAITALVLTQRRDKSPNGQFADIEILDASGTSIARADVPLDAALHRVALPQAAKLKSFVIRAHMTHSGQFASLAELDVELEATSHE
jgi:hypothetical protein